jgi:amino acid transporter
MFKKIYFYTILSLTNIFFFILPVIGRAAEFDKDINDQLNAMNEKADIMTGGSNAGATLGKTISYVIQGFLGLLGIIFIILMLYAGYNWMTASGDEAKVQKAKDTIQRAVIGLIITVAAYGITYFVFQAISGMGGTTPG